MSEERMERKFVARSAPPKAATGDCKKSSDAAHKPWPKSGKKREAGGPSGRGDVSRRSVPPPRAAPAGRSRGSADHTARSRDQGSGLECEEAELGSVFVPGSKKQSLNHLLNFVYSPRERGPAQATRRPPTARARPSAAHPHHAQLFLQASCQFAVKEGGEYDRHLLDPDLPVDWDLVEHVVVQATGGGECPICLSAPVAARVARCGHVYCWPCALHYAAVHERAPPPCPVCTAPLHVDHMRSAAVRRTPLVPSTEEVEMRLVRRARGSTLVESAWERDGQSEWSRSPRLPRWGDHADLLYAKIVTITAHQVRDIIARERGELSQQILDEIDTSELEYLQRALDLLALKEKQLEATPAALPPASPPPPVATVTERTTPQQERLDWFNVTDDVPAARQPSLADEATPAVEEGAAQEGEAQEGEAQEGAAGGEPDDAPVLSEAERGLQAKYFYFYQASDGQQVFLHGLDVRLLSSSWGGLVAAPPVIRARRLRTESFSVTHQSRGHMPCTAHLPLYCPYDVVELDLRPPHVTQRARRLYAEELERRARARQRAVREERRRERRAAPALPPASLAHYPAPPPPPPSPPPPHPHQPRDPPSSPPALSFAKMASGGGGAWSVRAARAPPGPAPEDGSPPPRALLLGDAIEAALAAPGPAPARNKKRNKHKVLFSLGAAPRV